MMIQSADDYQLLMEQDGTYADQSEAAVAAMLLGVELTIYASAAPAGVDPSPQNLYREAAGLGELCQGRFIHSVNGGLHIFFGLFRLVPQQQHGCVCARARATVRRDGGWSTTNGIVNEPRSCMVVSLPDHPVDDFARQMLHRPEQHNYVCCDDRAGRRGPAPASLRQLSPRTVQSFQIGSIVSSRVFLSSFFVNWTGLQR